LNPSAGKEAGLVYEGEQRFNVVVRLHDDTSRDIETIKNLLVPAPNGAQVPLSQLADIQLVEGPAQISREDTRRRIGVELNVRGRDIGSFVEEAQARIEQQVKLPPGYYVTWGGTFENLQRASARLLIVVPLALFLIFVLLFTTFGSVKQALLIYTGIPFAVVGGIFALFLRGMPFSISAGVGFIALFGVAVLNGVVMVSYVNKLREEGRSVADAVREGAETRLPGADDGAGRQSGVYPDGARNFRWCRSAETLGNGGDRRTHYVNTIDVADSANALRLVREGGG